MFQVSLKLPYENNKEYAYRVIKEGIMSFELQPGQAIHLKELAENLKISTTPIMEAIGRLKQENLIEVIPQVGTYISRINLELIEEAAFMRFVLEKEILLRACTSFPRESLFELKRNLSLQEMLLNKNGTGWNFQKLDIHFHYTIFQGNQRQNLWDAITLLDGHYNRMMIFSENEHHIDDFIAHHKKLITMIENKEIDQIENLLREHILEPIKCWENLYTSKAM
jgi:GntR family transcriptional regulator, rspAB operon transcriptional repressor